VSERTDLLTDLRQRSGEESSVRRNSVEEDKVAEKGTGLFLEGEGKSVWGGSS